MVKWPEGYIIIKRDKAFPARKHRLKAWLRLVSLDEREVEILKDLAEYLKDRVEWCLSEKLTSNAKRYEANLDIVLERLEAIT